MSDHPAFELVDEQSIAEIDSLARLYRHRRTGGEVLSLVNTDENKVFGITFGTPAADSTGVAHILEHAVLCGSRKYPLKKPFVELLKGSLHTFLNAMTFPDKTSYPVASPNEADFYNLVDVYLDAVLFPTLSEETFRQEGWHYELAEGERHLSYRGVVFNEMKGYYSSPLSLLGEESRRSLFPDSVYGQRFGGQPAAIPELSYDNLKRFHTRYYHPSNARVFFSGDGDPARRLEIVARYFSQFEPARIDAQIAPQPRFTAPRQVHETYPGTRDDERRRDGMVTVNWLLDTPADRTESLTMHALEHVLIGTPASPVRKALTDSGLGEDFAGGGYVEQYLQPTLSFGMRGIDPADAGKVESLILDTLTGLAENGADPKAVEAALNSMEFRLRENNSGSTPRGLSLMFRALKSWRHGGDPFAELRFEAALAALKGRVETGAPVFSDIIGRHILDNPHRTTVVLQADPDMARRLDEAERGRLGAVEAELDDAGRASIAQAAKALKAAQEAPESAAQLAKIPVLKLGDLDRDIRTIPLKHAQLEQARVLYHELPTNGIGYLNLGFDLTTLPRELWPLVPLFCRALLQTGTQREDFVSLSQRIGRSTGGIAARPWISAKLELGQSTAWLFVHGKAVTERTGELLAIIGDVLMQARLNDQT
ncbi:MAG TPA: insulinase family protein, partial [Devosiaceae bacterium]|nr:insulinase family protein [Devosiaceae bacterium]